MTKTCWSLVHITLNLLLITLPGCSYTSLSEAPVTATLRQSFTSSTQVPIDVQVFNPCALEGVGEEVRLWVFIPDPNCDGEPAQ